MKQRELFKDVEEKKEGSRQKGSELVRLVDRYGELTEMEKKIRELKEKIKQRILKKVEPPITLKGLRYSLDVQKVQRVVISPEKALEILGKDIFLRIVSVKAEAAKKVATPEEYERMIERTVETVRLVAKPNE